jgi:hypothetical protein
MQERTNTEKQAKLVEQIHGELRRRKTSELLQIWKENNRRVWSDEAFTAIQDELQARQVELPAQAKPRLLFEWEEITYPGMRGRLRAWGIGLILLGAFHFWINGTYDPIVGGALAVVGVVEILLVSRWLFLANTVVLLTSAGVNLYFGKATGGWLILGMFQIFMAAIELYEFFMYASLDKAVSGLPRPARLDEGEEEEDLEEELEEEEEAEEPEEPEYTAADIKRLTKELGRKREWADWWARRDAAVALGSIGHEASDALPALKEALNDDHEDVRKAAAEAIQKIEGDAHE